MAEPRIVFGCFRSPGRGAALVAFAIISILASPHGYAVERSATAGSGSRRAREEAIAAIPWRQLPPPLASRLQSLVLHPSIYRRMPTSYVECDPQLHLFFVRNPEALVSVWQSMGITNVTVERPSPTTFQANDGMGTLTQLQLVYATPDVHLFYGTGYYDGDLVPGRVNGHGAVLLRSRVYARPDGKQIVQDTMDAFIKIESGPLDVAAKTLHPLFMKYADINFVDTTRFIGRLSLTAYQHPDAMQHWIPRLPNLNPLVRTEFAQVVTQMATPASPATVPASYEASGPSAARWVISRDPVDGPLRR
jgi:hypothetical protein